MKSTMDSKNIVISERVLEDTRSVKRNTTKFTIKCVKDVGKILFCYYY